MNWDFRQCVNTQAVLANKERLSKRNSSFLYQPTHRFISSLIPVLGASRPDLHLSEWNVTPNINVGLNATDGTVPKFLTKTLEYPLPLCIIKLGQRTAGTNVVGKWYKLDFAQIWSHRNIQMNIPRVFNMCSGYTTLWITNHVLIWHKDERNSYFRGPLGIQCQVDMVWRRVNSILCLELTEMFSTINTFPPHETYLGISCHDTVILVWSHIDQQSPFIPLAYVF